MSKSASDTDEFYVEIHRRMVESGEWDRILRLLTSKLSEHGWVDEIRHRAKERARSMDALSFRLLLEEIMPPAQASIPPAVKREVTNILRQYVKDQFEK
ncbi:transcription factor e(y)2-domain-containing protein [Boletus reticuloceps]|uniref:Transcription and mRNA export factor SUS1 n=1 Tax=Boletus reticuloceps TaxID=495285 RepID=A0A8I2YJL0_9AGAM|nr:transcription factor e(y)2-domain-containing protein [Boletus reticuloceps]